MGITSVTRQAYSEVDNFLDLLPDEEREEIPKEIREMFKREKDKNYFKIIDLNVPVKDQNLKAETLAIIAFLNLNYWCKDEEEKEYLRKIYKNNDSKYEEILEEFKVGYDPTAIFNTEEEVNKNEVKEDKKEEALIVPSKEDFFTKMINKLKKIFKK